MIAVCFLRRTDTDTVELLAPCLSEQEWLTGREQRQRLLSVLAPAARAEWWVRWLNALANGWRRHTRRGEAT